jgi:hypothetical protein
VADSGVPHGRLLSYARWGANREVEIAISGIRLEDALSGEYQEQHHRDGFVKFAAVFSPAEVGAFQAYQGSTSIRCPR